jgi:hypothetical protein
MSSGSGEISEEVNLSTYQFSQLQNFVYPGVSLVSIQSKFLLYVLSLGGLVGPTTVSN